MESISAADLAHWLDDDSQPNPILLDVREFSEVEQCQIPGSVHMEMRTVPARLNELNKDIPIVCICHHGARSLRVAHFLNQHDFKRVLNLTGGIHAWAIQVDPAMETY